MQVFRLIACYLANTGRFDFPGFLTFSAIFPAAIVQSSFFSSPSLPRSFPFCTRVARISSVSIVAVKCFSPWKDIVLPSACLYNLGNAIFPRTDISTPPLSSHVHTEGALVDGGRVVDPSAPAPCRFRSFIEKSVEKGRTLVDIVVFCGTLEGRKKIRQDGVFEGETIYRFLRRKREALYLAKMTIRRGWLGKRLFIATHIQSSRNPQVRCIRLWIFRIEFSVKRRMRIQFTRKWRGFLYKNCYNPCSNHGSLRYYRLQKTFAPSSLLSGSFRDLFNDLVNNRHLSNRKKRYSSFYARTSENPVSRRPLTHRINLPKRVDLSGWRISIQPRNTNKTGDARMVGDRMKGHLRVHCTPLSFPFDTFDRVEKTWS